MTTTHFKFGLEDGSSVTIPDAKANISAGNVNAFAKNYAKLKPSKAALKIKLADKIVTSTTNIDGASDKPIGEIE